MPLYSLLPLFIATIHDQQFFGGREVIHILFVIQCADLVLSLYIFTFFQLGVPHLLNLPAFPPAYWKCFANVLRSLKKPETRLCMWKPQVPSLATLTPS